MMTTERALPVVSTFVDHIPVLWINPPASRDARHLLMWLPGLGGTKEDMIPYLQDVAAAGFVALSYDPWQHGARGTETSEQLGARVFSAFYRHMWPILGQTTLDAARVIDWASAHLAVIGPVRMGGVSMGGDIAVAAAGFDRRITCVAALVATPDWLRPGMQVEGRTVDPGEADAYARFFYNHINPLTHVTSYAHRPAITFECGAEDIHVPPDGALRFDAALRVLDPGYGDRLRVTLHPGIGHAADPILWRNCLDWLIRW